MSISASPGRLSCGSSLLAGGPLCIILGALCFSTTGTVQALAPDGSHPLGIGALRMQIGALALWAWCACRHSLPAGLRHWQLRWLIPATLGLLGFQVFFFWGVQQAGVAVGTVTAIGFSPVMAAILARIILGERPARIWYPATGLALAGLVLLNLGSSQDTSTAALLLPLLAGACYGAYFVFSKPLGRTHAPEHIMLLLCAGSGLLLLPVHFCTPPLWLLHPQGMGMALYLGVVTAALAFSLTLAGLRRTPTAMAATLALVEPLGAACWGIFLLHEPVGGQELAGMGLLFGGVALLALGKKTENTPPTEDHASSRPLSGEGAPPALISRQDPGDCRLQTTAPKGPGRMFSVSSRALAFYRPPYRPPGSETPTGRPFRDGPFRYPRDTGAPQTQKAPDALASGACMQWWVVRGSNLRLSA